MSLLVAATVNVTVVIDCILSMLWTKRRGVYGSIFRGRTVDGRKYRFKAHGYSFNLRKRPAMGRAPLEGEVWTITGTLKCDPEHGEQVIVEAAALTRPSGRLLIDVLRSERFPGVGMAAATTLWDRWGERLYGILDSGDEGALIEALGTGKRSREQISTILAQWPLVGIEPTVLHWMDGHGFPRHLAQGAARCYGTDVIRLLEEDPYRLTAFGQWEEVDPVARRMGVTPDDPRRLAAACEAVCYARMDLRQETVTDLPLLRDGVRKLLGASVDPLGAIRAAVGAEVLERVPGGFQALGAYGMERYVADRCRALLSGDDAKLSHPELLQGSPHDLLLRNGLEIWQQQNRLALNRQQVEAVHLALTSPLGLLVGSAGVGKTTVLKAICDLADKLNWPLHLIALSGRASRRMSEATKRPARTIAGFLGALSRGESHLDDEPLIVVDEASMVDLPTLFRLLRAAPPGCRFLFVGDPGQLPPIGPGRTLHDLVGCGLIPKVELTEVMRSSAETGIPQFSLAIREGRVPDLQAFDPALGVGVSFMPAARAQIVDAVLHVIAELGPAQVVGSVWGEEARNDGGLHAINAAFHEIAARNKRVLVGSFVEGEPVIWTMNDWDRGVLNGTMGIVLGEDDGGLVVEFDDCGTHLLGHEDLSSLGLSYAVSAHKAQGSQFERIVVPVYRNRLLNRNLLYTAVTRAKRQVVLVGEKEALQAAVGAEDSRKSALAWHLEQHLLEQASLP
ncbi:hypothetical protein E6C67_30985 [Azospirillum sp. TSA2s]|uniref:AAA family ATPase n=1 Tax=Azospirillum sp. TSA2s TaxID=709810 RepID=UPI0010AA49E0|nr:AAA family ATPase [Azospirillum sp. TSA2s]QCG98118.1 hypothetical protein E6C67_30985 [Azospirillum sp. TSA2s]